MRKRIALWAILTAAMVLLSVDFSGSAEPAHKLVKVGGMKNHCDCTYRIE